MGNGLMRMIAEWWTGRGFGVRWVCRMVIVLITVGASWFIYKAHCLGIYRRDLAARGFPESYVGRLAQLQWEHSGWRFKPLFVTDLTWDKIIEKECTPSMNLVVYADWAYGRWNVLKEKNYTPYYAKNAKAYDSGSWYQASRETIAYFMDPRNFLNERDVFMFETLGFDDEAQTRVAVERTLAKTFMANRRVDGEKRTFAELVFDIGRKLGVSPVFLAGRLASEQGDGSTQAFGTIGDTLVGYFTNKADTVGNAVVWGKRFTRGNAATAKVIAKGAAAYNGYYNFFNFRAYGLGVFEIKYNAWVEATAEETRQKYLGPWNTQARAIEGGSLKIKERYIDTHRHTRYLQKFSVLADAGEFRWKQYMQNIAAPLIEARNTSQAYDTADTLDAPYTFLIPVYRQMPNSPSPDPAKGNSIYSPSR